MNYQAIERRLPGFLRRHILHFESAIDYSLTSFVRSLPHNARVLDAGAGERVHAKYFKGRHYVAVDLGVGDASWDYGKLDAIADLTALPFREASFDACINIVTLEHVREPGCALQEIGVISQSTPVSLRTTSTASGASMANVATSAMPIQREPIQLPSVRPALVRASSQQACAAASP